MQGRRRWFMRRGQGALQVFARAGAGIDKAAVAQPAPGFQIKIAPTALVVWAEGAADVWTFVPVEPQPAQIVEHCSNKFLPAALEVEILIAEDELAAGGPGSPPGRPEG